MQNKKNIITLLWISILLSLVNIFATYLIIDYKTSNISQNVSKIVVNNILENEYKKFWWKENYETINKIQAESMPKIIEQYNSQKSSWNTQSTNNTQVQNDSQNNWIVIVDASKTIAWKKVTKTKDWLYVVWNPDAKISIVEYSDLECPSCNQFHYSWVVEKVLDLYWDKTNFTFKHYPLKKHEQAFMEAQTAECVWEIWWSDKFYTFVINTFANSKSTWTSYTIERILDLVSKLWIDSNKVKTCLENEQFKTKIEAQISEWSSLWVNSTPTIIIKNNETWTTKLLLWTTNINDFKGIIDWFLN